MRIKWERLGGRSLNLNSALELSQAMPAKSALFIAVHKRP